MGVRASEAPRTKSELLDELERLRGRLGDSEQTLDAIRCGQVDTLVVTGPHGDQIFALDGAERTYRVIVETMNEAALTVGLEGEILFCNQRFCDLLKTSMQAVMGNNINTFFGSAQHAPLRKLLADAQAGPVLRRLTMRGAGGAAVSVQIAASLLEVGLRTSICLVVTDLTELEEQSKSISGLREQQKALEEGRAELEIANQLLRDSSRAAVNIMEDAVDARREADETNEALQSEMRERKRAEEALQRAHDELEDRIRERTAALTKSNEQLAHEIEERKRAEERLHGAFAEILELKERAEAENVYLKQEVAGDFDFRDIIGQSGGLSSVFLRVMQVAPQEATALLLGETGTGKGVIARAIHANSARKSRAMITVNCTALPGNLIESELFGRERGAFTGANARQIGRFELADGGTLFLDEIGEMPLELQAKLLRVIQDGEFERLGSPRTHKVNVRIIAASNRNLQEEVRQGRFREDLFYRLNVFPIEIPPLRQRKEDIPLFVNYLVAKFNKKTGKKIETLSKDTLKALQEYSWPGNVRELESVIERAVITSPGTTLQVLDRFDRFRNTERTTGQDVKALAELERDHILQVLQETGWRIEGAKGASILLGLNPSTLRARMRKLGIRRQ